MKVGWEKRAIGEVCKLINGKAYKKEELLDAGPYPVLRVGNFFTNNHWYYSDLELDEDKYCSDGDLLYAWSASFGPRIWSGGKVIYHYHIWKVLPVSNRLNRDFLYYFFDWDKELIKKEQGAGATMIHVSKGSMEARSIPLPPLEEQQQIVAILDEAFEGLDRARAHAEANLQNARELYDTAVSEIFAKVETSVSDQKALGEIAEFRNGLNFTRASKGESVKIVGVGDFKQRFTVPIETLSDTVVNGTLSIEDCLQEGDLLAVRSNGNKELIGRTMIVPALTEKVSFSGFTIRIRLTTRTLLPEYLCELMRTKPMRRIMIEGGGGANISNLNQKILADLPISVPSPEAQKVALDSLELVTDRTSILIEAYKTKIADIADLRQSLLQKAFAGELT